MTRSAPEGAGTHVPAPSGVVPGRSPQRLAPLLVGFGALAATALVTVRSPHAPGSYGTCPLVLVTGLWCPLCGGLRTVHELGNGDLGAAWGMNPLVVLAVPLALVAWFVWLRRPVTGRIARLADRARSARGAWAVLGVLALFGLLRNVPAVAPWLAPGGAVPPLFGG